MDGAGIFSVVATVRTKGNRHKLQHWRLHLNVRKKLFPMRVPEHWTRLPTEVVMIPSLDIS